MKILITGVSGLIGNLLAVHLKKQGHEITALNRSKVEGFENIQGDISNLEDIKSAFINKDLVIHMSAYTTPPNIKSNTTNQETWEGNLNTNIIGVYNVFEASRLAKVPRVIFGSSGAAIGGYSKIYPYNKIAEGKYDQVPQTYSKISHSEIRPLGIYGAAKVWGEAIARHFSDTYGISILCLRIGSVRKENYPNNPHRFSYYLSHSDIIQMVEKCITAPKELLYDIFMACSDNKYSYYDLEHAKKVIQYTPIDSAESAIHLYKNHI
ncbi:MAG: hypothetical protein CL758_02100 [Chloroflexi bacterium]|nr:hypothetical protein [Chloroflexota bacterium]|tara:strand:+ start:13322 stop:14119 length:798 start_codon:yes stop_codon:yes gene_type:complete